MRRSLIRFAALFLAACSFSAHGGSFFRQYWAEPDPNVSNCRRWLRVNDTELSLHETFGRRDEARANGLMLLAIDEDLFELERAELYLEMWGGHPGTANARFLANGKQTYHIPEVGTESGNCTYSYPTIAVKVEHLVRGVNALQFACDRGESFWGHFIIDNAAVRCHLKGDHPDVARAGLKGFSAELTPPAGKTLGDITEVSLSYPEQFERKILSVDYFGRYLGFDDNSSGLEDDWHGFTHKKQWRNHVGSATSPPFSTKWDTSMIVSQARPMALRAVVNLEGGLHYATGVVDGLTFPRRRNRVEMYKCSPMPVPFWSRASRLKKATIVLPADVSSLERVRLLVKIWDGGEGGVKEPFKINGHPYPITSRMAVHDVVFTVADVEPGHLRPGENQITLLSDTEHHGIEVLLPGPVLVARYSAE